LSRGGWLIKGDEDGDRSDKQGGAGRAWRWGREGAVGISLPGAFMAPSLDEGNEVENDKGDVSDTVLDQTVTRPNSTCFMTR
jgi:hypothetical protein